MKKLISILLAVAMLACFMVATVSADEVTTASIYGSHVTAKSGESTTVSVTTTNESGFCAFSYVLTYDPAALTVNSVSGNGVMSNIGNGSVLVTFQTGDNVTSHTFTVNFTVNGTCGNYGIGISVNNLYAFGENSAAVVLGYSVGGGSITVAHDYQVINTVASTCEVAGYTEYKCSLCGDTYKEALPLAAHTPAAAVIENNVPATCTTDGSYDEVVYCSVCGDELSRNTVTVPGGHKWADGWSYNDETHWHECLVCGERCEHEAAHQTKADGAVRIYYAGASADHDGLERWQCLCGYTWEEVIPADPNLDPDIPPTGDVSSRIALTTGAILVTMMGAVALVVKRKTAV